MIQKYLVVVAFSDLHLGYDFFYPLRETASLE
jgi:hypothetical protein